MSGEVTVGECLNDTRRRDITSLLMDLHCERSEHLRLEGERPRQIDTKCCPAKP